MSMTITVTNTGTQGAAGVTFDTKVLLGAIEVGGASNTAAQSTSSSDTVSITPVGTSSHITFVAADVAALNALTAATSNSLYEASVTASNAEFAAGHYNAALVTAGTPVTVGATGTQGDELAIAAYEILAANPGTVPATSPTGPAQVNSATTSGTTAAFSPPPGSVILLAVEIGGNNGAGNMTVSVTNTGGLIFTRRADIIPTGPNDLGRLSIYTATVPGSSGTPENIFLSPTFKNQFFPQNRNKYSVLYDYQLSISASYSTAGDLAFGATAVGFQTLFSPSPIDAAPGPAWINQFDPGNRKRQILFDRAPFFAVGFYNNPSGDLTFGATATGFQQALGADRSQLSPGPAWKNRFFNVDPNKYPVQWDSRLQFTGVSSNGSIAFGAITTGFATIAGTSPAAPALPGPAWQNQFKGQLGKNTILFDGITFAPTIGTVCLSGSELDTNNFGGTQTDSNEYGGTATEANLLGGTEFSGCTLQAVNITLGEFNDETIDLTITNNSAPFNLSGYGLQALFKTAPGVLDSDPSTLILSTGNGAITITSNVNGTATLVIPNSDLQNTNFTFWRVDVTISGTQATAMYGSVTIRAL